jgi:hypothetical protein
MILVSVDIDGTLEAGDPPGPVPLEFVRRVRALGAVGAVGAVVGSSSDRTIADQRRFWRAAGVRIDFVVLKHQLPGLPGRYTCDRYLHVGDSMMDEYYAGVAGFDFWNARSLARYAASEGLAAAALTEYLLRRLADGAVPLGPSAAATAATAAATTDTAADTGGSRMRQTP